MYPRDYQSAKPIPLQSWLFGHRIQPSQTKYEYLIEFLQVALARKKNTKTGLEYKNEMFPVDEDKMNGSMKYYPITRTGLKRFIFFPKSKMDGKAKVDSEAYDHCVVAIKNTIANANNSKKRESIEVIQNLLRGFGVENQNRSWFDQNMLPVCPEVVLPEGMGLKTERKKIEFDREKKDVDDKFDYHRYTYMCRGGEIYYLHVLNALNEYPEEKERIEKYLSQMIRIFPQFSSVCNFIETTWDNYMNVPDGKKEAEKTLGAIPEKFSDRNWQTLMELKNFLSSKPHPFEKMEIFSNGIILQILRLMYTVAVTETDSNCWVVDVNCKGHENQEVRKLAISSFKHNEEVISQYLYHGLEEKRDDLTETNEIKIIRDAAEDSYQLFRKLGKTLGIVIPNTGAGMRFSLSEEIIKFLVLAMIPPKRMVTLDEFMESLYTHYGMVIGEEQYRKEMKQGFVKKLGDLSFLKENEMALAQKLKDCGFLRELSDDISIVENPYESEM